MNIIDSALTTALVGGIGAIAVALIGRIIFHRWERYYEAKDEVNEWYRDSLGLIGKLQQTGYLTTEYQQADFSALKSELNPLAGEILEHASSAPDGVDQQAKVEMTRLAAFSTGLITLSDQVENIDASSFFQHVQDQAVESYDGETSMEEVNTLIESLNAGALAERMDEDVDTNDEVIDEFLDYFSEESIEAGQPTSIEEALNIPFSLLENAVEDDDFWDEMVRKTLREYIRLILIDLSDDVFQSMEARKQSS